MAKGARKGRAIVPEETPGGLETDAALGRGPVITEEVLAGEARSAEELVAEQAHAMTAMPAPTPVGTAAPGLAAGEATMTLWGDVWRRLRKNRLAIIGVAIIIALVLAALLAPFLAPYPPGQQNIQLAASCTGGCAPSLKHWAGTDQLGRDYFSRLVFGARTSVMIGVVAVGVSLVIGLTLGAIAGYYGGPIDGMIMRLADVFFAYPFILAAIVLITVFGERFPRLLALFLAIGILGWATIARLLRASVLQVKSTEYVEAARALGAENRRILLRHVLPNAIAPVIVYATIATGTVILTEAALSFLGLGVPIGTPAWGLMVSDGRSYLTSKPWLVIFPGVAIMFTVMGFIFLGDGLRDSMDPRLR